jgi:hypothetical protein
MVGSGIDHQNERDNGLNPEISILVILDILPVLKLDKIAHSCLADRTRHTNAHKRQALLWKERLVE